MRTANPITPAPLETPARVYVIGIVLVGAAVVGRALHQLYAAPLGTDWLLLVALTLLTGSFTIKVAAIPARVSVSETFVFASVLLFGTAAGTVTVVIETLVMSFWQNPKTRLPHRVLFNISAPAIAIWVSSYAFFWLSGTSPTSPTPLALPSLFLPLAAFTTLYFLLNTWLVTFALALEKHRSPFDIWWPHFSWVSVNYFSGASVAAVLVTYSHTIAPSSLAVIVPLLVISYLSFRTAMGRVDDATRHLGELNKLYLSTIETLAMAIDAKDQITHGHIRRVQSYAVGLATRVGVLDEHLIKAIEAAALLHDMGKLAVPEYILNKPGRLSPAEFEKMKLHASVGADILSAIDFPYPVVPIVRHHHENWDGTGYPAGLKGTAIPIGARILSVVDCFDALTSDRPYRPKLSNDEALKILNERRGTMYDPLIVNTFVNVHEEIAPDSVTAGPPRHALNEITSSAHNVTAAAGSTRLDEIAASADEMLTLYDLARTLAGQASTGDTGDIIARHLRRLIPFSLCAFYLYDAAADELEVKHAMGDPASVVKGLRVPLGQRLSGWVAANRQTILNSDPSLDLGEVARCVTPRLRSCLSTPLLAEEALVGVLTLYSSTHDGFSEDHRRIVEVVARQIGHTFRSALEFDSSGRRDFLTGLPSLKHLEQLVDSATAGSLARVSLLLIDVVGLKQINASHGRGAGDEVLRHTVKQARAALRVADILFRSGGDEFVALLNDTGPDTATEVAARIRDNVRHHRVQQLGEMIQVDATVTAVSAPVDGHSLRDLMAVAHRRLAPLNEDHDHSGPSVH